GDQRLLDMPGGVLGFARTAGTDRRVVLVNFTDDDHDIDPTALSGTTMAWRVDVASDAEGEGRPWRGRLAPDQAVVLSPAGI
ncbi:MAG: hypothetical protein M0Z62_10910, partial [Actinomycetota bacterium]|nr:hypothetical protein [Actinomycetota bacterium]